MDSFTKASDTTTGSNPEQPGSHNKASPTELLSDAKLVAGAAQSALNHDTSKVDKERVAGAAENILDSAEQYGKLDEKGMGKYVDKAEEYLHKYNTSAPGGSTGEQPPRDGEKEEKNKESGGGGIGDCAKMAQGFFK